MKRKIKLHLNEKGSLSITALWMMALLSLISAGMMRHALHGLRWDNDRLQAVKAAWLARAGIQHAIAVLKADAIKDSLQSYDAFDENWANRPELFKKVSFVGGHFEITYETVELSDGPHQVYGIYDENRKININRVSKEILARLPGMSAEKLAALLDWRDEDDEPEPGGAESDYYLNHRRRYTCKNADIDFLQELKMVKGFTDEDIHRLSGLVTVYGDGGVNLNTTSIKILQTLGLKSELAKKICKLRWGSDFTPFTEDDVIFKKETDILQKLMKHLKLTPAEQVQINRLVSEQLIGVTSTHFTVYSLGKTSNGQAQKLIAATVNRISATELEIVAWSE